MEKIRRKVSEYSNKKFHSPPVAKTLAIIMGDVFKHEVAINGPSKQILRIFKQHRKLYEKNLMSEFDRTFV